MESNDKITDTWYSVITFKIVIHLQHLQPSDIIPEKNNNISLCDRIKSTGKLKPHANYYLTTIRC